VVWLLLCGTVVFIFGVLAWLHTPQKEGFETKDWWMDGGN